MRICKILLFFVVMLSVSTVYAQSRDEIATVLNEAGEAMNNKDYPGAIKKFEEGLKMLGETDELEAVEELEPLANKGLGQVYRTQGMILAHSKKYEEALVEFKKSVEYYKSANEIIMQRNVENLISTCYIRLATTKAKAKQYTAAIGICNEGLKLNPNDTKLMILMAQCYERSGKDAQAIATYEKVMALGERIARLRADGQKAREFLINSQLADAVKLSEKGNKTAALAKVKVAEKYNPTSPQTALIKINIYSKAKDYNAVVAQGPAALKLQKNNVGRSEINFMIGAAYVGLGNNVSALKHYKLVTTGKNLQTAKSQITQLNTAIKAAQK